MTFAAPSNTLGISAKSIHAHAKANKGAVSKKLRFDLQRVAQSLLFAPGKDAADQKRVCWCHRSIMADSVGVYRTIDGKASRYANVSTCGSVWHCPVCAAKVAESRREELQRGMVAHVRNGGAAYLLSLTFPHEADHDLGDMLTKFDKARAAFKNCRTYKRILGTKRDKATGEIIEQGSAGVIGAVSSLECTVSLENGWHPHVHMLVFAKREGLREVMFDGTIRKADNGDLLSMDIDELKKEWVRLLLKNGLGDQSKLDYMLQHALNVRGGEYAAEYIAKFGHDEKWGTSRELTSQHAKVGAAGKRGEMMHFTPFQLLAWAENGDGWAMNRFREYADAFEGKRMLTWSPRLKRDLGLNDIDLTDEEIAAAELPEEVRAGSLNHDQFAVLLTRNALGDFLRYVQESCTDPATSQADIDAYILAMESRPATHGRLHRLRRVYGSGFATVGD